MFYCSGEGPCLCLCVHWWGEAILGGHACVSVLRKKKRADRRTPRVILFGHIPIHAPAELYARLHHTSDCVTRSTCTCTCGPARSTSATRQRWADVQSCPRRRGPRRGLPRMPRPGAPRPRRLSFCEMIQRRRFRAGQKRSQRLVRRPSTLWL